MMTSNFRIYLKSPSPIDLAMEREKEGERKLQKCEYLENQRSFFGKIKNFFIIPEVFPFIEYLC